MAAIDPELRSALATLSYTEEWLDLGIVDRETILAQRHEIEQPDADPSTEHYRYGPLREYTRQHQTFTDKEFRTLLVIAHNECSLGLGPTVYHDLVKHGGLTDAQFDTVSGAFSDNSFDRVVRCQSYQRKIRDKPDDLTLINGAITYALGQAQGSRRDPILERWLIECVALHEAQLERLAIDGTKTIRNLAKIRLQKLRKGLKHDGA